MPTKIPVTYGARVNCPYCRKPFVIEFKRERPAAPVEKRIWDSPVFAAGPRGRWPYGTA
jgi:hypothetical protein